MTYVIQIVAMVIALGSQFFESVKKDNHGKKRTTAKGFPLLTVHGCVIFGLIIVSFLASAFSTWRDKREAQRKENNLSAENRQLLDSVRNLTTSSSAQFAENLARLEALNHQAERAGRQTAKSVNELQTLETQLVPAKYIYFAIMLDAPTMTTAVLQRELGRLAMRPSCCIEGEKVLRERVCGGEKLPLPLSMSVRLSSSPDIDYLIAPAHDKSSCSVEHFLQFSSGSRSEEDSKPEEDRAAMVNVASLRNSNVPTRLAPGSIGQSIVIESEIRPEEFPGRSLSASSFGQHAYAKVEGANADAEHLGNRLPKSITVHVEIWNSLPEFKQNSGKPSSVKSWRLVRLEESAGSGW
jgi:hypothetical protein